MLETLFFGGLFISGASILSIFKKDNNKNKDSKEDYYKITLDYCSKLTFDELKEYVSIHYVLSQYEYKIFGTCNDSYLAAKHIAELAEKFERPFNNRYSTK